MNLQEIMVGGGCLVVLMTLVQVTPFKVNHWESAHRNRTGAWQGAQWRGD